MIGYGVCIGSEDQYQRFAYKGLRSHVTLGVPIAESRYNSSIFKAYNSILEAFADEKSLEGVVLLHEDVEIRDHAFEHKVRAAFGDDEVAVLGVIGGRRLRNMAWWDAEITRGRCLESRGLVDCGGGSHDVDSVDGLLMALSPWAVRNLRFDATNFDGFHGYDADICFQARTAGKRVRVIDVDLIHHVKECRDMEAWQASDRIFQAKWAAHLRDIALLDGPSSRPDLATPAPDLDSSDALLEQLWTDGVTAEVIDRVKGFPASTPIETMLRWSLRLRSIGRGDACPLLHTAADVSRRPSDRAAAAAAAWALAKDPRSVAILSEVKNHLTVFELTSIHQLAPELVEPVPDYYTGIRPELLELIPREAKTVVELGCAAGALGHTVKARQQCRYIGLDLSPEVAKIARNSLDEVIVLDLDKSPIPLEDGTVDCVVCGDVLEHLKDPWAILAKIYLLLKPGGTVIVSIPNIRNLAVMAAQARGEWDYVDAGILDRTHLRFFTRRSFERALLKAGFDIVTEINLPDTSIQGTVTGDEPHLVAAVGPLQISDLSRIDIIELTALQFVFVGRSRSYDEGNRQRETELRPELV